MSENPERPSRILMAEAAARSISLTGSWVDKDGLRWWLTPRGHGLAFDKTTGKFEFLRNVKSNT